jgi:hypothetical protein
MNAFQIKRALRQFTGTSKYWRHLYPSHSPLLITDGCRYVRDELESHWLFDNILLYQDDKRLKGLNFQLWELRQSKKDLSWLLTCREDSGNKPIISQVIEFSDFPLDYIKLYVICGVALLPSEN